MRASRVAIIVAFAAVLFAASPAGTVDVSGQAALQTPEQFLGFRVGADRKLARWDRIVEYMKLAQAASDRVRVRELGKSTEGNAFIAVEIASPDTHARIDYFKGLQRRLYFQDGAPTDAQRDEIFRSGKAVVVEECTRGTRAAGVARPRNVGPDVAARNSHEAVCVERARLCPGPRSGIVIMPWATVLLARWYALSKSDPGLEQLLARSGGRNFDQPARDQGVCP